MKLITNAISIFLVTFTLSAQAQDEAVLQQAQDYSSDVYSSALSLTWEMERPFTIFPGFMDSFSRRQFIRAVYDFRERAMDFQSDTRRADTLADTRTTWVQLVWSYDRIVNDIYYNNWRYNSAFQISRYLEEIEQGMVRLSRLYEAHELSPQWKEVRTAAMLLVSHTEGLEDVVRAKKNQTDNEDKVEDEIEDLNKAAKRFNNEIKDHGTSSVAELKKLYNKLSEEYAEVQYAIQLQGLGFSSAYDVMLAQTQEAYMRLEKSWKATVGEH